MSNRKLKNIYLVGVSRCGKTTTASKLQERYGYTHIIMDAVIETMNDIAPQLGIKHGNLESEEFKAFLKSYSRNLFKYTKHNIIDLEVLSPEFARELINPDESVVIYMGYPSITPEEKMEQIREHDTRFDWTKTLPDEELLAMLEELIGKSKSLQEEAEKNGFIFIDTSFNRDTVIDETLDALFQSGQLDRSDDSYDIYDRTI